MKNSDTISKLSLDILPNTSSNTIMFGFGSEQILLNTALRASDAIVLSYPEPGDRVIVTQDIGKWRNKKGTIVKADGSERQKRKSDLK